MIRQLIYAGNLHKHKSFKNEHEIRITTMDNKSPYGTEYALKEIGNVVKKVYILKPDIMGNSKGTSLEKIIDEMRLKSISKLFSEAFLSCILSIFR